MKLNASEFNAFIDTAVFLIHNKGNVLKFKDVYFLLKFFFFFSSRRSYGKYHDVCWNFVQFSLDLANFEVCFFDLIIQTTIFNCYFYCQPLINLFLSQIEQETGLWCKTATIYQSQSYTQSVFLKMLFPSLFLKLSSINCSTPIKFFSHFSQQYLLLI